MRAGDTVGDRFDLDRIAGSGGMGEVFRAFDRASGEVVAVKVLMRDGSPEAARFVREARVLAELSHPGIVRYVADGITASGERYIAMEWLEGEDLRGRLLRVGLSLEESVRLAIRVAEALKAAHSRGVIHRDLKPSNLFLPGGLVDQAKLLDFGIARLGSTQVTRTGTLLGTPGYMAPEQARGGRELDARADVFSLGCVLYECVTGTQAFPGEHAMAILTKVLCMDLPRVSELCPDAPPELDALVAWMLAKDPEDRPRDGAAVVEALAAIEARVGWVGDKPMSSKRTARLTGSERRALSVVLIGGDRSSEIAPAETVKLSVAMDEENTLRLAAETHGGRLECLADGSILIAIAGASMATDQAAQAARCALGLRRRVGNRPMALATGSGDVTGRTLPGDAIDRAAKMIFTRANPSRGAPPEDAAPIAIDEVTAGLLDARFEVRETETAVELHGERDLAEGARTLLGKPTACVGRDREIGSLAAMFRECAEDPRAQAVLATGPAGIGKSRVAYELMRVVRQDHEAVTIWMGRGDSLRAGSAFGLLIQAVRGACEIREGDPIEARRERLLSRVARHVPKAEVQRVAEFLGEMIGTKLPDENSVALRAARKDAQIMGDQIRLAWEDFLGAECSAQPVLLVLEDLHWGDLSTVRLVDGALRKLKERPWMVLALARPEVRQTFPRLWADRSLQEIRLQQLSRKASERLVRQVLGGDVDPEVMNRLVTRADGNAFYLEELIRATAEREGEALPETVVAMVQSRLGALDGESRRVLRAASVFGEVSWPGGVASLLGGERWNSQTRDRVSDLVEREMLVQRSDSRFPGEEELVFRHALLREGAYAMLTDEDRILGHRLAGKWLEDHGESDSIVLAEHFERGMEPIRAGSHYLRAAEQASRGKDTDAALAYAHRGLACGVPKDLEIGLSGALCEAHGWRSEWSIAVPYADAVMSWATPGSARWAQAAAMKLLGEMQMGNQGAFMAALSAVQNVDPAPDAVSITAFAFATIAFVLDYFGLRDLAGAAARRLDAIVEPVAESDPIAAGWMYALRAHRKGIVEGDPWAGLRPAESSRVCFAEARNHRGVAVAQLFTGMCLWLLGAFPQAERNLRSILNPDEELGGLVSLRSLTLVRVLIDRGLLDDADLEANRMIEAGRTRGVPVDEGRGRMILADLLRRRGELEAAEREVLAAADLLAILPLDHLATTATLAAIRLAQRRAAEALAAAELAASRYETLGSCGHFRSAFIRLVRAECLDATGDVEAARAAISTARERLLGDAARIDHLDDRNSFLENVPENARTLQLAQRWLGENG
jgi:eukaryotic-like serine/threonine-protein kinase